MIQEGNFLFLHPWRLILLLLMPVFGLWFLFRQRHYWRDAFAFSQLAVLKQVRTIKHPLLMQRILPITLLLALCCNIIGFAEPVWRTRVATHDTFLMLVLDISISMEATDLSPNRLEAAKSAALDFVRSLPDEVTLGLEFFAGNTYLVSPPVKDHQLILEYLNSLKMEDLRPGTAIGDAMLAAIESLRLAQNQKLQMTPDKKQTARQPQGAIILLTDGESNLGIAPNVAVEEALKQKVTVSTIGIGDEGGTYVRDGIFTHLDEVTLQTIAEQTGGDYHRARSVKDFKDIYRKIARKTLHYEEKDLSLMPWCLVFSGILVLGGLAWLTVYRRF